jgi:hypothetical protein
MSAAALIVAALAACQSAPPPPPKPEPTLAFVQKPVIIAPASAVSFKDEYVSPMAPPNVEQEHDVRPAGVVQTWVNKRIRSTSAAHGDLTIEVLEASVVEQPLKMDDSLKARVTKRQEESKLVGKLRWRITYKGPVLETWTSEGEAEGSSTVLEQSSPNDREQAYADLIDGLAQNFDLRMEQQLAKLRAAQSDAIDAMGH